ncbi:MAG: hypothetical protein EZS28_021961 [Streblomastix strix]|uniref:Uncharacterized protein n=1 Tax=Streblomastix strix TaxID=222440 RepID=A0A5J4VIV1_9EUKA|nr:MAG: hypothetical protein EZS28_021961 [Streblomastix strix]
MEIWMGVGKMLMVQGYVLEEKCQEVYEVKECDDVSAELVGESELEGVVSNECVDNEEEDAVVLQLDQYDQDDQDYQEEECLDDKKVNEDDVDSVLSVLDYDVSDIQGLECLLTFTSSVVILFVTADVVEEITEFVGYEEKLGVLLVDDTSVDDIELIDF